MTRIYNSENIKSFSEDYIKKMLEKYPGKEYAIRVSCSNILPNIDKNISQIESETNIDIKDINQNPEFDDDKKRSYIY